MIKSLRDLDLPTDHRRLSKGEYLFRSGDESHALFAVELGRVRLERPLSDGFVLTVHTARPGQTFAEASLFAECYHCDAVAEVSSRLAVYPKRRVLEAFEQRPGFALDFSRLLAEQVRSLRALLEIRNIRSADERVAQYLRLKALAGDVAVDRPVRSIAAEVGLTQETLYRVLARLERDGVILRQGRRIQLAGSKP